MKISIKHGAFSFLFCSVLLGAFVLPRETPSYAEDRMVLGPHQYQHDTTGKGAVLCSWAIFLTVQTLTKACQWERNPADDAIDKAIAAIDEFIIQNSSLHPTAAMLQDFKRRAAEGDLKRLQNAGREKYCNSHDFVERFRSLSPEQIDQSVKELLSMPREPTMNPCL